MNSEDLSILRKIKNYILSSTTEKKVLAIKKELIKKEIEETINKSSNDQKKDNFKELLTLMQKLKNVLIINEKDNKNVRLKKKDLSEFLLEEKKNEINLNLLSQEEKIMLVVKLLKMLIEKKNQILKLEIFFTLKQNFFILKNCNERKDIFFKKISVLENVLKMVKEKSKDLLPFSKRRALFKWKIIINEKFVKECVDKIALNAKITNLVVLWRMKKISENKELENQFKFLFFVQKFSSVTSKAEDNHKLDKKVFGFDFIKIYSFKIKHLLLKKNTKNFLSIFQKKIKNHSFDKFNCVLNFNHKKIFIDNLKNKIFCKKQFVFRKFSFLLKEKKILEFLKFRNLILKKLKKENIKNFEKIKNPFNVLENLFKNKKNQHFLFLLNQSFPKSRNNQKVKLISTLNKLFNKKKLENKKYFFSEYINDQKNKQKTFLPFLKKCTKIEKQNKSECFKKIKNYPLEKRDNLLKKITNRISDCLIQKKTFILRNLIENLFTKKQKIYLVIKRIIFSSFVKKQLVFNLLKDSCEENEKNDMIKKIIFQKMVICSKMKKFSILRIFEKSSKDKKFKIQELFKKLSFLSFQLKKHSFENLKRNSLNFDKEKKVNFFFKLLEIFEKKNLANKNIFLQLLNKNAKREIKCRPILDIEKISDFSFLKKNRKSLKVSQNISFNQKNVDKTQIYVIFIFTKFVEKIIAKNNILSKLIFFEKMKIFNQSFVLKKFGANIIFDFFHKKQKKIFCLLKNQKIQSKKKVLFLIDFFQQKNLSSKKNAFFIIKRFLLDKIKNYFLKKFAKNLSQKMLLKKNQIFLFLKKIPELRKTKLEAAQKLKNILSEKVNKNKNIAIKKMLFNSKNYLKKNLQKFVNNFNKKKQKWLEENFYLLKCWKDNKFDFYRKNPFLLPLLKKIVEKNIKKKDDLILLLKEPIYFKLKENAKLLKPFEKKHLNNLNYLIENEEKNLLLIKQKENDFFSYSINIQQHQINPLQNEINSIKKKLIEFLKEKAELINELEKKNLALLEESNELYLKKENMEKIQKIKQNDLNKILEERNLIKKNINSNFDDNENYFDIFKKMKNDINNLKFEISENEHEINQLSKLLDEGENENKKIKENFAKIKLTDLGNIQEFFENEKVEKNDALGYLKSLITNIDNLKIKIGDLEKKEAEIETFKNLAKDLNLNTNSLADIKEEIIFKKLGENEFFNNSEKVDEIQENLNNAKIREIFNNHLEKKLFMFNILEKDLTEKILKMPLKKLDLFSEEKVDLIRNDYLNNTPFEENIIDGEDTNKKEEKILNKNEILDLDENLKKNKNEKDSEIDEILEQLKKVKLEKEIFENNVLAHKDDYKENFVKKILGEKKNIIDLEDNIKTEKDDYIKRIINNLKEIEELKKKLGIVSNSENNLKEMLFSKKNCPSKITENMQELNIKKNKLNDSLQEKMKRLEEIEEKLTKSEKRNEPKKSYDEIYDLERDINQNKEKLKENNELLNKKQGEINENKEVIDKNKDDINETLYKFQQLADNMKKQTDLFKDYEKIFKDDFQKIYKQKELILRNIKEINEINEKLDLLYKKKNMVDQALQVEDTRKKLGSFFMLIIANAIFRKYLTNLAFFFNKSNFNSKRKNNLVVQNLALINRERKKEKFNKEIQVELKDVKIEKKFLLFFIITRIFRKKKIFIFKELLSKAEMRFSLKLAEKLNDWKLNKKSKKQEKDFTRYMKKKEILLNFLALLENIKLKNISIGLKNIYLASCLFNISEKNYKFKCALNVYFDFKKRYLKYYLMKWHSLRNKNLFKEKFIHNIIWKTNLAPQIALWRFKSFPLKITPVNIYFRVGLILLKKIEIKIKYNAFQKLNNRLLTLRDDYKTRRTIKSRSNYDTVGFSQEDYLTRKTTTKNLDLAIASNFTSSNNKNKNKEKLLDFEKNSHITDSYFNTNVENQSHQNYKNMIYENESEDWYISPNLKNISKFDERHKELLFLIINQMNKKKYFALNKFKYHFLISKDIQKQREFQRVLEREKKLKLEKLQKIVQILLEENKMNKKENNKTENLILNLKDEIYENKFNLKFVKDNYQWIFLNRIQNIFDNNYIKEIMFSFEIIKNC